jgi:ATP-dependent Clp protease ATP-binding subunit ClpA
MSWFGRSIKPEGIDFHDEANPTNFTPRAQQALGLARKEAERFNHNFVGTEHVLLGVIKLGQGVAVNVLQKIGLDLETVRSEVEKLVGTGPDQKMVGNIPYTPRVKRALSLAGKEAKALRHTYIGTEHILLGLLQEGDGVAARVLTNMKVDIKQIRQEVLKELDPNSLNIPGVRSSPTTTACSNDSINLTLRYDLYAIEAETEVVYRNVLIKRVLAIRDPASSFKLHFLEIEQSNGQNGLLAAGFVTKLCPPGTTLVREKPGERP